MRVSPLPRTLLLHCGPPLRPDHYHKPIRHLLLSRTRVTLIHLCSLVPVLRPFQALQSISHRNGAGITQRALDKWPAAWDQKGWEEGGTEDYGSLSWGGRDWTLYRSLSSAQMSSPATGISTTTNATPPIGAGTRRRRRLRHRNQRITHRHIFHLFPSLSHPQRHPHPLLGND